MRRIPSRVLLLLSALHSPFGEPVFAAGRITNLCVRTTAGSGSDTLIGGFVTTGTGSQPVLVRAIGPTLASFGVQGALPAPQLTLYSGSNSVAQNAGWGGSAALSAARSSSARSSGAACSSPT